MPLLQMHSIINNGLYEAPTVSGNVLDTILLIQCREQLLSAEVWNSSTTWAAASSHINSLVEGCSHGLQQLHC